MDSPEMEEREHIFISLTTILFPAIFSYMELEFRFHMTIVVVP
jgi:hypothetical protein